MIKVISILISVILVITSCSKSEKDKIIGKWTVTNAYASRNTEASGRFTKEQADRIDALLTRQFKGTIYHFMADGKLTITMGPEQLEGTWEMEKDEKNGNAELSMIKMKGTDWANAWVPATGESLFYMKGIDDHINARLLPAKNDGTSVVYSLSKNK